MRAHGPSVPVPLAPAARLAGVAWACVTAASLMSSFLGPGPPCQGEDPQASSLSTGSGACGGAGPSGHSVLRAGFALDPVSRHVVTSSWESQAERKPLWGDHFPGFGTLPFLTRPMPWGAPPAQTDQFSSLPGIASLGGSHFFSPWAHSFLRVDSLTALSKVPVTQSFVIKCSVGPLASFCGPYHS